MLSPINDAFIRFTRRAEQSDRSTLVETFVDTGNLFALLSSNDHQIIYGRRGTGKTHALSYLAEKRTEDGDLAIYIDLRNIGSSGGLYADPTVPITERASRLLIDTLARMHEVLLEFAVDNGEKFDLSKLGPLLDLFADSLSEVRVTGTVERSSSQRDEKTQQGGVAVKIGLSSQLPKLEVSASDLNSNSIETRVDTKAKGVVEHVVHFGGLSQALTKFIETLKGKRVWLLLDEWSAIPLELQPYLADLLRRSVFPVRGTTVKIAAIEHRSKFRIPKSAGDYLGLELGADATADVNLDDFMVFENDEPRAKSFFRELIFKHYSSVIDVKEEHATTSDKLIQSAFTQRNAFDEFVRASEGVPRDAINIISLSAQKAQTESIAVPSVRAASKSWYDRDKGAAVNSNPEAGALLNWIVDEVIGQRKARAFLLQSNVRHPLIDTLFDARVLHVLKRNIASNERPGIRFDVYKLDFGCYVDLITTAKSPAGLLPSDENDAGYVEVPPDDYRSIRRAILEIDTFEKRTK